MTAIAAQRAKILYDSIMSGNDTVCPEDKKQVDVIMLDASRPQIIAGRYPTGWKFALVITSLVCGILLVAIDNTIIAVAVPKISTEFKALDDVGWYGSAYCGGVEAWV